MDAPTLYNTPAGTATIFPEVTRIPEMAVIDLIHKEAREMLGKENISIYHGHVEAAKAYRLCREALQKLLEEQEAVS